MVTLRYVLTPGFDTEMHAFRLTRFTDPFHLKKYYIVQSVPSSPMLTMTAL